MSISWLITTPQYPSGVPFKELGITSCVRSLRNRGASSVSMGIVLDSILDDPPMSFGDWVTIVRNGVIWFAGQVSSEPNVNASPNSVTMGVTISDPWHWWSRITYIQTWPDAYSGANNSTRTMQGADASGGSYSYSDSTAITTDVQLTQLLEYAQTSAGLSPSEGKFSIGDLNLLTVPMYVQQLSSGTVSEHLEHCLKMHPNVMTRFDYANKAGGVPSPKLYMTDWNAAAGWQSITLPIDQLKYTAFSIRSRPDLVLPGVAINYEYAYGGGDPMPWNSATTGWATVVYSDVDASGHLAVGQLNYPAGALISSLQVGNGVQWELGGGAFPSLAPVPYGLANLIYLNHLHLHYDGSISFVSQDPGSMTHLMGSSLNFSGGRPEWLTMDTIIQSVTEDVMKGTTTLSYGSPQFLQLMSFKGANQTYSQRGLSGGKASAQSARDSTSVPTGGISGEIPPGATLNAISGMVTGYT